MIKWNKHRLPVATLTDCHLEDMECGKYQLVFASAENVLKQILLRVNLRVQFFVASKYRLRPNGRKKEKSSNRLTAAILKDFRLENMECSKYQLIFVTAEEVLSKPILFCLKIKNCFTFSLIGSMCVCFCRMTMLPVFNLNHFDWLPTHFGNAETRNYSGGVLLFNILFG